MRKFASFPEAFRELFSIDIATINESIIKEKVQEALNENRSVDAFIMALFNFPENTDDVEFRQRVLLVKEVTGIEIDKEKFNFYQTSFRSNSVIDDLLYNQKSEVLEYENMIILFAISNGNSYTVLSFLLSGFRSYTRAQQVIIEGVIEFWMSLYSWDKKIWDVFHEVSKRYINQSYPQGILDFLAEKLINANPTILQGFYWYYTYLGYTEVSEIIFRKLTNDSEKVTNIPFPFTNEFIWTSLTCSALKKNYDLIVKAQNSRTKETGDSLISRLSIVTLIPLCLYAKLMGNTEVEARILLYAIKNSNSKRLLERMAELTGSRPFLEFVTVSVDARSSWLNNKLQDCQYICKNRIANESRINSCIKAHALLPFNLLILGALMFIESELGDKEAKHLIYRSVWRSTQEEFLKTLRRQALSLKCDYAVRLISSKLDRIKKMKLFIAKNITAKNLFVSLEENDRMTDDSLHSVLNLALELGITKYVLLAYKKLAESDPSAASFYNLEAEPHFLRQKINFIDRGVGTANLVSKVWGIPVFLENPIDKLAWRVGGSRKD